MYKRFVRKPGGGTEMKQFGDKIEPNDSEYVACPVSKGSLVIIHGLVYHKSMPNLSKDSRWIYTFHMIDGSLDYPKDNWLLPTVSMPFTKLNME